MYTNNLEQLTNFIYFMLTGITLSIVFDIFRILRRSFKTSDILTNIEDVIFGVVTGIIILLSIFLFNNGEIRLYIFIGMAIGIVIYMIFISKYFIRVNTFVISIIKKIIIFLTKPFIFILKYTKRIFFKPISFIFINIRTLFQKLFIIFKKYKKIDKKINKQEGI